VSREGGVEEGPEKEEKKEHPRAEDESDKLRREYTWMGNQKELWATEAKKVAPPTAENG